MGTVHNRKDFCMETDRVVKKEAPKPAPAPFPNVLGSAAQGTFVPMEKIKAAGHPATIMVIVTNSDDLTSVEACASDKLMPGDSLMRLQK